MKTCTLGQQYASIVYIVCCLVHCGYKGRHCVLLHPLKYFFLFFRAFFPVLILTPSHLSRYSITEHISFCSILVKIYFNQYTIIIMLICMVLHSNDQSVCQCFMTFFLIVGKTSFQKQRCCFKFHISPFFIVIMQVFFFQIFHTCKFP